ncbi:MAG: hypothetical protein BWK73_10265 [Thiothrix lacustris]|uniref:DUF202 domain-containing protein n=1 Tax=Thiothrix lacustris TaxID=525917 RepID=A0A1Y1QVA9_9GAMM|nr:MAG: hypothetical protein BWK73_10265 [Thiothrix lacustris]
MIKRYTDHSANERTYLAWIRTAIAVMTFGFLIEKFDLFLSYLSKVMGATDTLHSSRTVEMVGVGLFLIGILIIVTATTRFFQYKCMIESEEPYTYGVKRSNLLLSVLMIVVAGFLLVYIGHNLLASPAPPALAQPASQQHDKPISKQHDKPISKHHD